MKIVNSDQISDSFFISNVQSNSNTIEISDQLHSGKSNIIKFLEVKMDRIKCKIR